MNNFQFASVISLAGAKTVPKTQANKNTSYQIGDKTPILATKSTVNTIKDTIPMP